MERRRRNRHASPRPKRAFGPAGNPDNVIPAEHPLTGDEIIAGYGRALMRLGPLSNRELALVLGVIESIREYLGLKEITNEVVAWAVWMTGRTLCNRKNAIISKSHDLSEPPVGKKLPPE
jgi:hypothetical protein